MLCCNLTFQELRSKGLCWLCNAVSTIKRFCKKYNTFFDLVCKTKPQCDNITFYSGNDFIVLHFFQCKLMKGLLKPSFKCRQKLEGLVLSNTRCYCYLQMPNFAYQFPFLRIAFMFFTLWCWYSTQGPLWILDRFWFVDQYVWWH